MNSTRPQTTQDLMIILIQRVQRLERELKARTPIHKVDRGRSRPVMAWISKKRLLSATITLSNKVEDPILVFNKWYQSLVRSFDQEKNNIQAQQEKKMVKTSSSSENKPCCSKAYKKNTKTLNSKITDLTDKLSDANNMIYHYKLALAQVESRLVEHKDRELKYYEKIRILEFNTESRANCIKSLTNDLELLKKKKGYYIVPPLPALIYSHLKKDMSWTRHPECADDTTKASPSTISPKPFIKFVKANDNPTKSKTDKVETAKKPPVKYAKQYKKPTKKPTVRGNQRNWNNLKSQQLGANYLMKKKACYNYGGIDHLSYDCGKWVKMGRSCPKNNNTHKSMQPRPVIHRVDRFPIVDLKFSTAVKRVKTVAPRPNMNSTRPQTTQDLMIILIQRVQRLERELKARTPIHKVDRGRSRPVMAWISKKV
uniref:Ubiquitin hydrolase n=1 Tax=Tanacetum cinerariifolium TaxID=118510 RepID=A0A699JFX4_TANCI|nr:ubiquitin hydrolase [Tanacetum cinerariifolium]